MGDDLFFEGMNRQDWSRQTGDDVKNDEDQSRIGHPVLSESPPSVRPE